MKLDLLSWKLQSLFKNIKKKKFKALFRYMYDSAYRAQINHMLNTVRSQPVRLTTAEIPLSQIEFGHDLNYPEWVDRLRKDIKIFGYKSLHPVKVIWDNSKSKYLIVDGNHRLAALKKELYHYVVIKVELLVPLNTRRDRESI